VRIVNYAPRMGLDLARLSFPKEPKAADYGVRSMAVFTP
jgi:hypothetical protein